MLMSKKEYKKRSNKTILICSLLAAGVGTLQTGFIVWSIKNNKQEDKK